MPAPPYLDTTSPNWRQQFRGITRCKGKDCGVQVGWVIEDMGTYEKRVPYNVSDGEHHHRTCPNVNDFKRKAPPLKIEAEPKKAKQPKPVEQPGLFGNVSTNYGVD